MIRKPTWTRTQRRFVLSPAPYLQLKVSSRCSRCRNLNVCEPQTNNDGYIAFFPSQTSFLSPAGSHIVRPTHLLSQASSGPSLTTTFTNISFYVDSTIESLINWTYTKIGNEENTMPYQASHPLDAPFSSISQLHHKSCIGDPWTRTHLHHIHCLLFGGACHHDTASRHHRRGSRALKGNSLHRNWTFGSDMCPKGDRRMRFLKRKPFARKRRN
jgi:hypothetical protein